jgi:xanthine dehydrogenase iron-sulfur cluster and FAD-binding subunit A
MDPTHLAMNGNAVSVVADRDTMLDILRNHLGLKGTKFGCGLEQCGCWHGPVIPTGAIANTGIDLGDCKVALSRQPAR